MITFCRCCLEGALEVVVDFGLQPICSHFSPSASGPGPRHPLVLAWCVRCGQLQLQDPPPVALLRPPHPWITYIEPEGHLDRLVEELCALPGAGPQWRVGGVTYKDASTLERFRRRGWSNLWQLDPVTDLGIAPGANDLATLQEALTVDRTRRAAERLGRVDLLLVRHVLEHAHEPAGFLAAIQELVTPGGVIVFECPDSSAAFWHREFTVVWEEHALYFTPPLFARFFELFGMDLERMQIFPYPVENSLVALVRPGLPRAVAFPSAAELESERRQMRRYAVEFPRKKAAWRAWFATGHKRVAAFGAGHSTCAFINLFDLGAMIEFVADDHPKKQGLFLSGTGVPVRPSAELETSGVTTCLLGLSPESEAKVLARQEGARRRGVEFLSIFPLSPSAAAVVRTVPDPGKVVRRLPLGQPRAGDAEVDELRDSVRTAPRGRNRWCAHQADGAALHEMIICLHADSYVRPHRHLGKAESIHVVDGFADLVLFDDAGEIAEVTRLGPPGVGLTWFVRIDRPVFHTLVVRGEDFIFHESTLGPLNPSETELATWAPAEEDRVTAVAYQCRLIGEVLG